MTYDAENPGSGLRQAHKCDVVKLDEFLMVYLFEFNALASFSKFSWGHRGSDHMVVGFTTTYAISAYHH
jgi:hypothetical protein